MSAGVGGLAGATLFNPVNMVLDCDLYDTFHALAGGVEVNEETMAVNTTRAVGPRGHYLMEGHTIRHMREIPFSELVLDNDRKERHSPEGMLKTAREKVNWILENHRPPPLQSAVERELARIVDTADREIRGDR
jgi:trimethylamine--corrinoid protein Co-methyltransferase